MSRTRKESRGPGKPGVGGIIHKAVFREFQNKRHSLEGLFELLVQGKRSSLVRQGEPLSIEVSVVDKRRTALQSATEVEILQSPRSYLMEATEDMFAERVRQNGGCQRNFLALKAGQERLGKRAQVQ